MRVCVCICYQSFHKDLFEITSGARSLLNLDRFSLKNKTYPLGSIHLLIISIFLPLRLSIQKLKMQLLEVCWCYPSWVLLKGRTSCTRLYECMLEVEYICQKARAFILSMASLNFSNKPHNVLFELFAVGSTCLHFISPPTNRCRKCIIFYHVRSLPPCLLHALKTSAVKSLH